MILPIILYIIYLIGFGVYTAIFFYHLNEFGYVGDACRPMMVAYSIISILLIISTIVSLIVIGGINA